VLGTTIPDEDLKKAAIPRTNEEWKDIVRFTRIFNGYAEAGSSRIALRLQTSIVEQIRKDYKL
jgi:hypothetical protein